MEKTDTDWTIKDKWTHIYVRIRERDHNLLRRICHKERKSLSSFVSEAIVKAAKKIKYE